MINKIETNVSTLSVFFCLNALFFIIIGAGLNSTEHQFFGITLTLILMFIANFALYDNSKRIVE